MVFHSCIQGVDKSLDRCTKVFTDTSRIACRQPRSKSIFIEVIIFYLFFGAFYQNAQIHDSSNNFHHTWTPEAVQDHIPRADTRGRVGKWNNRLQDENSWPLPSKYGISSYICHILPLKTTKCTEIYHTWMIWVRIAKPQTGSECVGFRQ